MSCRIEVESPERSEDLQRKAGNNDAKSSPADSPIISALQTKAVVIAQAD